MDNAHLAFTLSYTLSYLNPYTRRHPPTYLIADLASRSSSSRERDTDMDSAWRSSCCCCCCCCWLFQSEPEPDSGLRAPVLDTRPLRPEVDRGFRDLRGVRPNVESLLLPRLAPRGCKYQQGKHTGRLGAILSPAEPVGMMVSILHLSYKAALALFTPAMQCQYLDRTSQNASIKLLP